MENTIQNAAQHPEREQLELLEKKIAIQKMRVEIKKEEIGIEDILIKRNARIDEQKVLIEKISALIYLLDDWTIDAERTLLASEPFFKPLLSGYERAIITQKLMQLVSKL